MILKLAPTQENLRDWTAQIISELERRIAEPELAPAYRLIAVDELPLCLHHGNRGELFLDYHGDTFQVAAQFASEEEAAVCAAAWYGTPAGLAKPVRVVSGAQYFRELHRYYKQCLEALERRNEGMLSRAVKSSKNRIAGAVAAAAMLVTWPYTCANANHHMPHVVADTSDWVHKKAADGYYIHQGIGLLLDDGVAFNDPNPVG